MGKPRKRASPGRNKKSGPGSKIGLILLYGLLLWLVISWGRAALWPRLVQVELVVDELFEAASQHRALVVRTEYVLTAPAEGTFMPVVADGEYVRSGSVVARIVNDSEQRRLSEELDTVEQELAQASRTLTDLETHVDRTMAALRSDFRRTAEDWRWAAMTGRFGDLIAAAAVMEQIAADMEGLQTRLETEQKTVQSLQLRREGLIAAQDNVVSHVNAPIAGILFWNVDGLEEIVTPEWDDIGPDDLFRIESQPAVIREGTEVTAGTPLLRLVDTYRLSLLVTLPRSMSDLSAQTLLRVGSREFRSVAVESAGPVRNDRQVMKFHVDRDVPELLSERFVDVDIIDHKAYGVVVPVRAVTSKDGVEGMYVVSRTIVRFTPVTVMATSGDRALVDGISAGTRVVVNPWLVRDGMSLP